jgi:hypothetical protein
MSTANEYGPEHYRASCGATQPWDYITQHDLRFLEGNVIKYITRWREPSGGGINDLRKAQHYIQKLLEIETTK